MLPSHPECPSLPQPLYVARPIPLPYKVMLADPVEGVLVPPAVLVVPASSELAELMLPVATPTLRPTCRLPAAPDPARHTVDESESHLVPSQALRPTLPVAVASPTPREVPSNGMLTDPVEAALNLTSEETKSDPIEYATDRLAPPRPTLTDASLLPAKPDPT